MARVEKRRSADANHDVVQIVGDAGYQRQPCAQCPWRMDLPAEIFPAEAFRISAVTAYDASMEQFACHMAGADKATTCAGFVLRNAANNLGARVATIKGKLDPRKVSSPYPLYESYRAMAIANGVDPDDPVLKLCRDD